MTVERNALDAYALQRRGHVDYRRRMPGLITGNQRPDTGNPCVLTLDPLTIDARGHRPDTRRASARRRVSGHQVEHTRERLRRQGVDPDGIQWDYGKIVGELRPAAEQGVRRALLLEAIADKESLAPSEDDVEAEIEKFAKASQRPTPAVRRMMEKSGDLDALRHGLRERKTLDLLIEHARIKN